MKSCSTFVAASLFAALVCVSVDQCALAQSPDHPVAPNTANTATTNTTVPKTAKKSEPLVLLLRPGTRLLIELSGSLNAKKLKPAQKIKAVLTQDLVLGGKLVAPVDSKVLGHVTEVVAKTEEIPESRLGFVFDKILLKHHRELEFQAVMQAAAPPAPRRSRVDEPDQMLPPAMMGGGMGAGPTNTGPVGRGGSGIGSRNTGATRASTVTIAGTEPVTSVHVAGTPGNSLGTMTANSPKVASEGNKPVSGGAGLHGVYNIKNLDMTAGPSASTPGPVLVSSRSTIKVEDGTQFLLVVTGAPVVQAQKQ
jgi:hypothetical protein